MISVIIPTYNEEDVIYKCIESLSYQTLTDFEVIVIDDGSNDDTLNILSGVPNSKFGMRVLRSEHIGAGAARNLGAASAKGEILVFVDADMTFEKDFLGRLIEPIEKGAKGTFSKEEIVSNWDNPWARCWNINEGWEEKRRHPKNYPDTQPVFRAILKSEFEKVNGFTPGGYNDDWSLWEKLGYEAESAPGATFYHKNPGSLAEIFGHAKWVGKRKYKLGIFGYLVAILRVLLPFSIIIGLWKGLLNKNLRFLIFKIVYDFGILIGILLYMFSGRGAK
jgi:glycosyltransferase involved in cell wall biosynthesis